MSPLFVAGLVVLRGQTLQQLHWLQDVLLVGVNNAPIEQHFIHDVVHLSTLHPHMHMITLHNNVRPRSSPS